MPIVPFFGTGLQGKSSKVTAQKRLNCYYEFQKFNATSGMYGGPDDRTMVAIFGTPGLELFVDFGDTPIRGIHAPLWNDYVYMVHRGTLWQVDNSGTKTNRGTLLTTSGRVSIADNGNQLMIVDGAYGYIFNTSTLAFTQITDVDFPAKPRVVIFHDGRFLVNSGGTGEFHGSSAYNGLTWDALDFSTAESSPDQLTQMAVIGSELTLIGDLTTEFWADIGGAGFPYQRTGGSGINYGIAAQWSVTNFLDGIAFLARQKGGEAFVANLQGYQIERISNHELDFLINGYSTCSDATAFSYILGGHPMLQINFPSADKSWLYDASTQVWSQLQSKGIGRHRAEMCVNFQNQKIVTDYTNGRAYKLKQDVYTDNGDEIALELIGRHLVQDELMETFPYFEVVMETGVGLVSGQGSNPQVMISVSKDGGQSYGTEIWVSAGQLGNTKKRARLRNLGRSRDITIKTRITDPIKRVIVNANLAVGQGMG